MKAAIKNVILATVVLVNSAATSLPAAVFTQPKLMVQNLSTKPEFAQNTSQDLLLRADEQGSTYLYVEQQNGTILEIFDVSDPAHMQLTTVVTLEGHGAYDFVTPIGGSAELVSFRNGSGTGVIDFHKPKKPHMSAVKTATDGATESLGTAGYLSSSIPQVHNVAAQSRDVQLIESNRGARVLTTLTGVTRQVNRPETGTIFLLAKGKVTVIRQRDVERQYTMDQELKKHLN
jgi:hypothetical protein